MLSEHNSDELKSLLWKHFNEDGAKKKIGRLAPSFLGCQAFPGAIGGSESIWEGFVWFCATYITHGWNLDTTWIIALGGHP